MCSLSLQYVISSSRPSITAAVRFTPSCPHYGDWNNLLQSGGDETRVPRLSLIVCSEDLVRLLASMPSNFQCKLLSNKWCRPDYDGVLRGPGMTVNKNNVYSFRWNNMESYRSDESCHCHHMSFIITDAKIKVQIQQFIAIQASLRHSPMDGLPDF